jgi:hypothetical protein
MHTPIDYLVAGMFLAIFGYSIFSMVRARRPNWVIGLIAAWLIGFIAIEVIGTFTANTISENLVDSIPLPVMIVGTLVCAAILCVHWYDLWKRLKINVTRDAFANDKIQSARTRSNHV